MDEPSFPTAHGEREGLTVRELFAGLALAGALARGYDPKPAAREAVVAADALIAQLREPKK